MSTITQQVQPTYEKMAIETFLNTPEVFCQRNTAQRVARTAKRLSQNPLPTHLAVVIGEYPDGERVILDGNTRRLAWDLEIANKPDYVIATIYKIEDNDEARNLYESLDSPDAVEKAEDKVYSAMKNVYGTLIEHFGAKLTSNGKYTSGLRYAVCRLQDGRTTKDKLVGWKKNIENLSDYIEYYYDEIMVIDDLLQNENGKDDQINAAIFASSLLLLKKYGTDNERLLNGLKRIYTRDRNPVETTPSFGKIDAIAWLNTYLQEDPIFVASKGTNYNQMELQLDRYLTLVDKWMDGVNMANNTRANVRYVNAYYDFVKQPCFEPLQSLDDIRQEEVYMVMGYPNE